MELLHLFYYVLGSKLRMMLESMQVLFEFQFGNAFRASCFEGSDLWLFWSFFFRQVSTEDSNGIHDIVLLFCHHDSSGPLCRQMLRSIKAQHEIGFVMDSLAGLVTMCILLLGFLLGAKFVERLETLACAGNQSKFGHYLEPLIPTNSACSSTQIRNTHQHRLGLTTDFKD